jgi:predicted nucleic acid-binding protein
LALYYLETSALAKLYVREAGTDRLLALLSPARGDRLAILSLSKAELWSAVRRRERDGEIASSIATRLLEAFQLHMEARFLVQPVSDYLVDLACSLVDRYGLRAFDALQLAGFLKLATSSGPDAPVFVCSDRKLLEAAGREGLQTLDPAANS